MLLTGAGLMLRTVSRLMLVDPGFSPNGVLTAQFSLVGTAYREDSAVVVFQNRVLERVRALPGVEAAALAGQIPMGGNFDSWGLHMEGLTHANPAEDPSARPQAETSTEAVRFSRISSVAVTRVVPDPASYVPGVTMPSEVVLTIGWNVLSHVDLEPAHCGDENCEADHGYSGTITADDLALRISAQADGEEAVRQVLDFASALAAATAHPDR